MHVRKHLSRSLASIAAVTVLVPTAALAFDFDLNGSLGDAAGLKHYVAPVSNPIFNETPYITTEARPMWLHQSIPTHFASHGGDIDVVAVQLRAAITDRLGFIATKDGWANVDFHDNSVVSDDAGAANLAFGLKYALLSLPDSNSLLTVGAKYEAPTGGLKTHLVGPGAPKTWPRVRMQGQGDGLVDLFASGATTVGPVGIEATLGTQLAVDENTDTSFLHYAVHADYDVMGRVFPLIELNGYTPIEDGNRTALGVNGLDLVNLGASNSKTVVTVAPGLRVHVLDNLEWGIAYEIPVTHAEDLMAWRLTTDFVVHL